jgi:hypothetical protein
MSRSHTRFANALIGSRRLLFGAALITLMGLTPAHSQISQFLGRVTEATIPSKGLSANFKRASRFTLGSRGTITRLCAYLDGNGGVSGTQGVRFALYGDNNGVPGTKVFETRSEVIFDGSAAHWYCTQDRDQVALLPIFPVEAGSYWIAVHTSGTGGVIRDFGDGSSNWYGNADPYADGSSPTFGTGSRGTGTLSVYAQYYPDSELRHAGRMTTGTVPSKGMTADFKRGSSFLLSESGRLHDITVYLDGGGVPNMGVQASLRLSIFKDANGAPGTKVNDIGPVYMYSSSPPAWITQRTFGGNVNPGRYWIVIHTGPEGGVVRNYGDGTAGNWYGNRDTFLDGASDPFGPGSAGNGTISAFVSYQPAAVTTGHLGRTDIGTKPSSGLKANFSRMSQFYALEEGHTITGLHAYLDGLGGASGSQKVRMVIYGLYTDFHEEGFFTKIAQSEDVTIAAGTPAQWVHFAVPPVTLSSVLPVYRIAIQSGDTAGVVRDFADRRPVAFCGNDCTEGQDWFGLPDTFADGAMDTTEPGTQNAGDGTLSVYAKYSLSSP